jgi:hypothetical protein
MTSLEDRIQENDRLQAEYQEELKKELKHKKVVDWLWIIGIVILVLLAIYAGYLLVIMHRELPVYHLNGACSIDYYVPHTSLIGKVVITTYEQVRVCP